MSRHPNDIRWTEPHSGHKGAFKRGWRAAQNEDVEYLDALEQLTWQNLGYRLGKLLGWADGTMIDEAFYWCERQYEQKLAKERQGEAAE
jgi:hypothetical protein